jgi:hypothetical protein
LFVLPVGGADVPIVISLLNAFTGLTVAASGYVLDSTLLIIAGTLVGASGTILTRLMAEAMGRSLFGTLFGAFTAKPQDVAAAGEEAKAEKSSSPPSSSNLNSFSAGAGAGTGTGAGFAVEVDDVGKDRLGLETNFAGFATTLGGEAWSLCTAVDIFSCGIDDAKSTTSQTKYNQH